MEVIEKEKIQVSEKESNIVNSEVEVKKKM